MIDVIDAASLLSMADRLRALLGGHFDRLMEADNRGRRSATPPQTRQRLIELIEFCTTASQAYSDWDGQTQLDLNGDLLAESVALLAIAQRWQNHPAWPGLRETLASDTEPPHTVVLLTLASYLVDAGNGVGLHVSTPSQHSAVADMCIEPDLSQRVDVEVKTPLALRAPKQLVREPQAIKILERALKKSSRQRSNTRSSLLVVGGFTWADRTTQWSQPPRRCWRLNIEDGGDLPPL